MKAFSLLYITLALLSLIGDVEAENSVSIVTDSFSCTDFDVSSANVVVSDDGKVTLSGTVGFPSGLESGKINMTVKKGILFNIIKIGNYKVEVDFCKGATSESGGTCPEEGTYTVDTEIVNIPSKYLSYVATGGDIFLYISDANGDYGKCKVGVSAASSSLMNTSIAAVGIVSVLTLGGMYIRKRRIDSNNMYGETEEPRTNFEMMSNHDSRNCGQMV